MNHEKYSFLFNKIQGLQNILTNKKLSSDEYSCLEYIYNYYKNPSDHDYDKKELRKQLKEKRKKISTHIILDKSVQLSKKLYEINEFQNAETIFCYISFNNEINTYSILEYCIKNKKELCVPIIKDNTMIASKIDNLNNLIKNKYNIPEPANIIEIEKNKIDLTIVPALAYNPLGYRIGYGGGFYDRFLNNYKGYSIGIILKDFYIGEIVPEKYDQPVNKIIIQS